MSLTVRQTEVVAFRQFKSLTHFAHQLFASGFSLYHTFDTHTQQQHETRI